MSNDTDTTIPAYRNAAEVIRALYDRAGRTPTREEVEEESGHVFTVTDNTIRATIAKRNSMVIKRPAT